ncbi:hypothetical protein [Helicobacter zhangjianzhongii]|nr:hypothetical protein [Helicobacter sp. CPD2-1]MDL0079080.1 hypothetical protein [Helicobacter sp. CPD2-1]
MLLFVIARLAWQGAAIHLHLARFYQLLLGIIAALDSRSAVLWGILLAL